MTVRALSLSLALPLAAFALGCGGGDGASHDGGDFVDEDGDGFSVADGDCNDQNASIHPGAPEPCDGVDNDCDGEVDEDYDKDGDGWTTCAGDCRDNDPNSYPGAPEVVDGIDNDCDGIPDNNTDQYDDDGDGYSEDQGDCNDDPNQDGALIGPGALEVPDDGVDNDCDGIVDEALEPCTSDGNRDDPHSLAHSMEACYFLLDARIDASLEIDPRSRGIFPAYGEGYGPRAGEDLIVLATGLAGDSGHPDWVENQPGTRFENTTEHPDPQGPIGCSSADPSTVNDYSELELIMQVPQNAKSFSFDFNFMSAEYPEFVCTVFDDTFLALLESEAFTGNISFDAMGNRVSVNNGFFDVCDTGDDPACEGDEDLAGTGYEGGVGGGTGWLTTTAPVVPGEKIRLTFAVFDEGDRILDSAVLIDNFRWELEEVDEPVTVEREIAPSEGAEHPVQALDPLF